MRGLTCKICGGAKLRFIFSQYKDNVEHKCYYCSDCDLFQTLGNVAPVSPDYVDLREADLVPEHVFLQRSHKAPAFRQWSARMQSLAGSFTGNPRKAILDIGCGVGGFLEFAASAGLEPYGFDASHAQVCVARERFPNVRHCTAIEEYVTQLDSAPAFSFITMWDVFEHIREPISLLADLKPYLVPDGLLYVSVPSGRPIQLKLTLAKLRNQVADLIPWEHVFYYTKRSLRRVLERSGFEVLAIAAVAPYVRTFTVHEAIRRVAHLTLARTPFALQICAIARPGPHNGGSPRHG